MGRGCRPPVRLPQALGPLQTSGWLAGAGIFKGLSETSKARKPASGTHRSTGITWGAQVTGQVW